MGDDDAMSNGPSGAGIKHRLDQTTNAAQRSDWAMGAGILPLHLFDLLANTVIDGHFCEELRR